MFNEDFKAPATLEEAEAGFANAVAAMGDLPQAAYRIVLPDDAHGGRGFDLVSIMFKNRMLYLHGPVTQEAVQSLSMQLHYLCSQAVLKQPNRVPRITLYVDSPGGLVSWGLTLFDYIRQAEEITREPVVTVIQTMGASMGSLLPQAATTGYRIMLPRAQMMIHALAYGTGSSKREAHTRQSGSSRRMMSELYEIYIEKMAEARSLFGEEADTPETRAEILAWLFHQMENEDTYLSTLDTLEAGLTDFVAHSETEQFEYYRALDWYHGLYKEGPNPEDRSQTTLLRAERDPQSGRVTPFELSDEEKARALDLVRKLQKANYEKTKTLEERRNPIVEALKALDDQREERGNGPKKVGSTPYDDAAKVYAKALKSKKTA